ncbi:MAG: hypothetical protein K2Y20_07060 [Sphingomonas sp.]|nr:hypothetical protein [Sphingomonas sp.]
MRYIVDMRTTLAIDDDVLAFARAKAARDRTSIGDVISALARDAIVGETNVDHPEVWNGIPQLPVRKNGVVVTLEMVNALRDDDF